ncbi:MAG TPA: redoxin domain-containing protein, partial [Flavobacteriales bacterium]|nr:redoxin domain-containing protein [Flavobacteriales bacterium]
MNVMKKSICFLILAWLAIPQFSFAQFTLEYDTVWRNSIPHNPDVVCHNQITNTSGIALNLKWRRVVNNLSGSWTQAICDPELCYGPTTNSATFPLKVGATGILDAHYYIGGAAGDGHSELLVFYPLDSAGTVQRIVYISSVDTMMATTWSPTDIEGQSYDLFTELAAGKPVVLEFMEIVNCTVCPTYAPEMQEMFEDYSLGQNAWFWALNANDTETAGEMQTYRANLNISYPAFVGASSLLSAYDVNEFPRFVVIGPDQEVYFEAHGWEPSTEFGIRNALTQLGVWPVSVETIQIEDAAIRFYPNPT